MSAQLSAILEQLAPRTAYDDGGAYTVSDSVANVPGGPSGAIIVNGRLYAPGGNFAGIEADVLARFPQGSALEYDNLINEDAPGNGAGKGSMKEGILLAASFIAAVSGIQAIVNGFGAPIAESVSSVSAPGGAINTTGLVGPSPWAAPVADGSLLSTVTAPAVDTAGLVSASPWAAAADAPWWETMIRPDIASNVVDVVAPAAGSTGYAAWDAALAGTLTPLGPTIPALPGVSGAVTSAVKTATAAVAPLGAKLVSALLAPVRASGPTPEVVSSSPSAFGLFGPLALIGAAVALPFILGK